MIQEKDSDFIINIDSELDRLRDLKDVEDTLIWVTEKFSEFDANELREMSHELLKTFLNYKNKEIIR